MASDNVSHEELMRLGGQGLSRFRWGSDQLAKVEEHRRWASLEFEDTVGVVPNEAGANLYCFMVTRSLKTATRCHQAAWSLLREPSGSIPVEILLRSVLVASAKAVYLLLPPKREARESRLKQVYLADRSSLDHAVTKEESLLGAQETNGAQGKNRPQGAQESKIIRDVLDDLVDRGNCLCGTADCPQYDLEGFRHRLMRWWWLYSSVAHVNVWHIEQAAEISPSGATHTTGEMTLALHDLGWIYAQAVALFLERYDFLEQVDAHGMHSRFPGDS